MEVLAGRPHSPFRGLAPTWRICFGPPQFEELCGKMLGPFQVDHFDDVYRYAFEGQEAWH